MLNEAKSKKGQRRATGSAGLVVFFAAVLSVWLTWTGTAVADADPPLSNTAVTAAQVTAAFPGATLVQNVIANGLVDGAVVGFPDCQGSLQSVAFALGGGMFLYAYELECHCGPNWDVGGTNSGGNLLSALTGIRVPVNGNAPLPISALGGATSFHTTNQFFQPYSGLLAVFNQNNSFSTSSGDFTVAANFSPSATGYPGGVAQLINGDGIFFTGDVAGFVTNAPPIIVTGRNLGGSNTIFSMVAPGQAQPQFGFTMSRTPAADHVFRGHSVQYTVNVNPVQGTTPPQVTLSIQGLPSATTATFSVNNATPPFTSILTIATTGGSVSQGGSPRATSI